MALGLTRILVVLAAVQLFAPITVVAGGIDAIQPHVIDSLLSGDFRWEVTQPLLGINPGKVPPSPENPWYAVKDPSVVRYQGHWHFCSALCASRREITDYLPGISE